MTSAGDKSEDSSLPYRVLARKYRPKTFADLIGQEAMVRILTNAIATGRLAHAFVLTGVRGIGKTTTARIIARALNCIGADGAGGPTPEPCGVCDNCRSIAEDRHVDVIEMDAASRTGVDDIRELIEGVRYKPVSARFKVYIIDEVHMLSKNAFNALLKTLEEPPEHVKFIFATTEIRKVPVTVLSRCQRFDLRRVGVGELSAHLSNIAGLEGAELSGEASLLLARAADGSVRDGLSLLDTAIAHGDGAIEAGPVRDMLGLADREVVFDLMDHLMSGDAAAAMEILENLYSAGADPAVVLSDLLDLTHWLTRLKILPQAGDDLDTPEAEAKRGAQMAEKLTLPVLTRAWQLLLKGLKEVQMAPAPLSAAEMVMVRLAYAAGLPTPAQIISKLEKPAPAADPAVAPENTAAAVDISPEPAVVAPPPAIAADEVSVPAGPSSVGASEGATGPSASMALAVEPVLEPAGAPVTAAAPETIEDPNLPKTLRDVIALTQTHREAMLKAHLMSDIHLVHFEPGRIEFRPGPRAPSNLAGQLGKKLEEWTRTRWLVSVSSEPGDATLNEQDAADFAALKQEVEADPMVMAVLEAFPGAKVANIHEAPSPVRDGPGDDK